MTFEKRNSFVLTNIPTNPVKLVIVFLSSFSYQLFMMLHLLHVKYHLHPSSCSIKLEALDWITIVSLVVLQEINGASRRLLSLVCTCKTDYNQFRCEDFHQKLSTSSLSSDMVT